VVSWGAVVGVGAFKVVPDGAAQVGGPASIRMGPSVTTDPPPEATMFPLPQQSWWRPNHGRSGNEKQQPHISNKPPAIVNEVK